jgi:hypothetical protein
MGIGTRMFRLAAVLPGVVLSAALTLVVSATLPPTLGGLLLVAYVVAAVVLAFGPLEPQAVLVLARARRATEGEEQLLHALDAQLRRLGRGVPDLYVARGDLGRAAAEPCGRRSVVVAPRMLRWLHREQVSRDVAAAIVAQAAAGLSVGPARFDLAVRLLTAPGALAVAMFHRVARLFTWVPGVLGLWRARAVFGVVAVWQCLQEQQVTIAVTTGALMAVSYTAPACARAWRRRVEVEADRLVATAGLGERLVFAVRSADEAGCVDRVHRIRKAAQEAGRTPAAPEPRRCSLYLVR